MKIETKYNIGDRVWVVYEDRGEVSVYDTTVDSICLEKDGISYFTKEANDYVEEMLIPYEEKEKLLAKIIEIMDKIHEREEKENDSKF